MTPTPPRLPQWLVEKEAWATPNNYVLFEALRIAWAALDYIGKCNEFNFDPGEAKKAMAKIRRLGK